MCACVKAVIVTACLRLCQPVEGSAEVLVLESGGVRLYGRKDRWERGREKEEGRQES